MAFAARLTDPTSHAGVVTGPGCPTVKIGGLIAAVASDLHTCGLPTPHPPSPFPMGSTTVKIGGKPAFESK